MHNNNNKTRNAAKLCIRECECEILWLANASDHYLA